MYVQVDAPGADAAAALKRLPGVTTVSESERHGDSIGYEVASEQGRDIRRDLAQLVVNNGWGLLELRPMRVSLEEIFLSLTTEEQAPAAEEPLNA
jgi:ABC-2 type transport system ATP-binding protein